MIFALVTFVPHKKAQLTPAQKLALYQATAPKYQAMPGLIRKYYIGGERAGGAYEWQSMEYAKAHFTPAWESFMVENYGADVRVEYFDCPCVVDNAAGTVNMAPELVAAAARAEAAE